MDDNLFYEMDTADGLCESFVGYVKRNYEKFSPLSKSISEGKWEEWIRNHIEAKIYSTDGMTLSGIKRGPTHE